MAVWFDPSQWPLYDFKSPYVPPADVLQAFDRPTAKPALIVPRASRESEFDGSVVRLEAPRPPMVIPGLVGDLVAHCWNSAPRQIAEVAIASALSSMAVLAGRQYHFNGNGLGMYFLVLAKTSLGKSFGFKANDSWQSALVKSFEGLKPPHSEEAKKLQSAAKDLIVSKIGSSQGLSQHMKKSPAALWHADEFVDMIKMMSAQNPPANIVQMKQELLTLVEMSGPGRMYRGTLYSNRSGKAEEVDVQSAALSILATGTPEKFYDDLTPELLTSGFIPRFTLLEYEGGYPAKNSNFQREPTPELMNKIKRFFHRGYYIDLENIIGVQMDAGAQDKFDQWENFCSRNIDNATKHNTPTAGLFSRAHTHVEKIAALIAIGCHPDMPTITQEHVEIAIAIVKPSLDKLNGMLTGNQIGTGDNRRTADVKRFIARMYIGGFEKFKHTNVNKALLESGVIQLSIVKNYCRGLASFRNDRNGLDRAFDSSINAMLKYGDIYQVDPKDPKFQMCVTINVDAFRSEFEALKKSAG